MPSFTDQTGRVIELTGTPHRIVSLVPSQTELLADLGLEKETIGITKFCVHPKQWFRSKQRVGGTKNLNIPLILDLQPDLVIANKEENVKEQIEELAKHLPVWISDVSTIDEAYDMIGAIGHMIGKPTEAGQIIDKARTGFTKLQESNQLIPAIADRSVLYLIWKDPYMTVGFDTFIHSMLQAAGYINIYGSARRYPILDEVSLPQFNPSLVFLSSEPYPFQEKHINDLKAIWPRAKFMLVDGEMFSWYGSRMVLAVDYFRKLQDQLAMLKGHE